MIGLLMLDAAQTPYPPYAGSVRSVLEIALTFPCWSFAASDSIKAYATYLLASASLPHEPAAGPSDGILP